ncbi:uncharacterized protein CBL_05788 [Carabus blaptoides fortunei]
MFVLQNVVLLLIFLTNIINAELQFRIVGGNSISIDLSPHQLSLMKNNKHICGAVIISKSWTLTSANCLQGIAVKDISLRAGSNSHTTGGTVHKVVKTIIHPTYDKVSKDYDIALVEVKPNFDLNKVKAITLASDGSILKPGTQVSVTGWGVSTPSSTVFPDKLQQITVPIIQKDVCILAVGKQISDRMICAGLTSGGKDICDGDFGGPMVYQDNA